jgi:type VI secretion system secreted protein VgrG
MSTQDRTVLEFRVGSLAEPDLLVSSVSGRERLSDGYAFDVDFHPISGEPLDLNELAGAEALLTLRRPDGTERLVHGVVWTAQHHIVASGDPHYRARVVPALDRLRHVRRSRIFQSKSVPDVVKEVLDEAQVKHRFCTNASYATREYCVQYRESNLEFIQRLLEEEGIFYWFEHAPDEHVMNLADSASSCADLPGEPTVPFRFRQGIGDSTDLEHLFHLERSQRLRTGKVTLKDFDFERPTLAVVGSCNERNDAFGLECYEYPGGFRDTKAGGRASQIRLEELRSGADAFSGESTCLRFIPGARFEGIDHPEGCFNRKLLLLDVRHEAKQMEGAGAAAAIEHGYYNSFEALDADAPYRPSRSTPRPRALTETATVVGPSGEEIHPDGHGRIKVHFHWDREGAQDDSASCWIRVAQGWAGAAWGASFVPRIGQEVLVRFLDGNPDRPIVMGAVYNGANAPPLPLPDEKTRSTLRTDSSPGSGGSNELRIEDATGSEEIYIHAQKDENIEIRNDKSQRVALNEALSVEKDRDRTIRGNQTLRVAEADVSRVDGNQTLTVQGDRLTRVGASHSEEIGANQAITVGGTQTINIGSASTVMVGAASALNIGGGYVVNVGGVLNEAVGGVKAAQVGGAHVEVVGGSRDETVAKNSVLRVGGDFVAEVKGAVSLMTAKDHKEEVQGKAQLEVKEAATLLAKSFKLEADKLTVLVNGKVAFQVEKSGKIGIYGSTVTIDGSSPVKFKGKKIDKKAGGGPPGKSAQVKQLEKLGDPKKVVRASFSGAGEKPALAGLEFELKLPDGSIKKGTVGADGAIAISDVDPGGCELSFPELGKAPTGEGKS